MVPQDLLVLRELQDLLVNQEHQARPVPQVRKDKRERRDPQVPRALRVSLERTVLQGRTVPLVLMVLLVLRDNQDLTEQQDHRDSRDLREM